MDVELKSLTPGGAASERADALVVLVPEQRPEVAGALGALIDAALSAGDLQTTTAKQLALYRHPDLAARRAVLAGCGDATARAVRQAVGAALAGLKAESVKRVLLDLSLLDAAGLDTRVEAAVLAAADTTYSYTHTRSKAEGRHLARLTLGVADRAAAAPGLARADGLRQGIEFAREWANRPANHATPSRLADAARGLAKGRSGLSVEMLGPREVERLGMGSFMAVAQGSAEPLRFIVLRWQGAPKSQAPVVLVGKGITFDTGGISLKPAPEMDEMKFDMGGAASVLGTFRALAEIKPELNVIGLIPACENMPDGRAVKPGDVVTSMSGQTIEILNTDAEGRLILCDALTYAERFKPRAVIDIATLTGACMIALGGVRSGLFASDDALADALLQAGERALDPCWRLPLDDDYAEGLKSNFADVANVGGRAGGAITAAKFLQRFAGSFAWAHLDIAGTAWKGGAAKGATGRPVGLLVHYLLGLQGEAAPQRRSDAQAAGAAGAARAGGTPHTPRRPRSKRA